ncbi:MAG TPA: hypothetical protein VLA91_04290 [Acidimicrobiia bacterium]|nr:hypothetical protein [Acidimicrobiia bacterium]
MTEREREIIVTDARGGGGNFGAIIAGVIIAVALILGVWYLVANTGDDGEVLPDEVNVTIQETGDE